MPVDYDGNNLFICITGKALPVVRKAHKDYG